MPQAARDYWASMTNLDPGFVVLPCVALSFFLCDVLVSVTRASINDQPGPRHADLEAGLSTSTTALAWGLRERTGHRQSMNLPTHPSPEDTASSNIAERAAGTTETSVWTSIISFFGLHKPKAS